MGFGKNFTDTFFQARDQQMRQALQLAQQLRDQNNFENQQADNTRADQAQALQESFRRDQLAQQKDWRDQQEADRKATREQQADLQKASLKQKKFDAVTRYAESLAGKGYSDNQIDTLVKRHQKRIEDLFPEQDQPPQQPQQAPATGSGMNLGPTLGQSDQAHVPFQPLQFGPMQGGPMNGPGAPQPMAQAMGLDQVATPELTGHPFAPITLTGGADGPMNPMGQMGQMGGGMQGGPGSMQGQDFLNQPPPSFQDKLRNTASLIGHRVNQDADAEARRIETHANHTALLKQAADRLDILAQRAETSQERANDYKRGVDSIIDYRNSLKTLGDLREKLGEKNYALRQKELNVRIGQKAIDQTLKVNQIAGKYAQTEKQAKVLLDGYDVSIQNATAAMQKTRSYADKHPDDFGAVLELAAKQKAVKLMQDKRADLEANYLGSQSDKDNWIGISREMMGELHEKGVLTFPKQDAGSGKSLPGLPGLGPQGGQLRGPSANIAPIRRQTPTGRTDYSKMSNDELKRALGRKLLGQ